MTSTSIAAADRSNTTVPTAGQPARNDGVAFERRFATIMREHYGVRRTAFRQRVKGRVGSIPHDCDVHGEVYSPAWDVIRLVSYGIALLAIACLLLEAFPDEAGRFGNAAIWLVNLGSTVEARARSIHASIAPYAVAVLGIACGWLAGAAKKRVERHVWAECKDRKSTIKRRDINVLAAAVADVRDERSGAPWRPDEVWFASTSAFDQDALAFAREHRIRCVHVAPDGRLTELT